MKAKSAFAVAVAVRLTASSDEHGRDSGLAVDGLQTGHAVAAVAAV